MPRLAFGGYLRVFKDNGDICTDATATWYRKGTTTLTDTWTTSAQSVTNSNPVTASALGVFPDMWLDDDVDYKVVIAGTGVTTKTIDGTEIGQDVSSVEGPLSSASDFRLSLTTAQPVTVTDVTAATTIYLTPCTGNKISLYDGSAWTKHHIDEISLALDSDSGHLYYHQSGKNFDLYAFLLNGVVKLGSGLPWQSNTTNLLFPARVDGVILNADITDLRYGTGANDYVTIPVETALYLGTFRASANGQTEDSLAKRFLWNMYNRVPRAMGVFEATDSWAYTTATMRQANASTSNALAFVRGRNEDAVHARSLQVAANSSAGVLLIGGIGLDSTTTLDGLKPNVTTPVANYRVAIPGAYDGFPGIGYHTLSLNEYSAASGTTTWYGDGGAPTLLQSGIEGVVMA